MKKKYRKIKDKEAIEIGDIIISKSAFGKSKYKVHRVTEKYCYVKYNKVAEGKFPRTYSEFNFQSYPKEKWLTVSYDVYKLITSPGSQKQALN